MGGRKTHIISAQGTKYLQYYDSGYKVVRWSSYGGEEIRIGERSSITGTTVITVTKMDTQTVSLGICELSVTFFLLYVNKTLYGLFKDYL